jgi:hypothetical protein
MVQLSVPKKPLHGLYGRSLVDQPGRHRAPTAMRRAAPYAGVTVQLRDVRLQAVARQVIDRLAGPAHAPLGVELEFVPLVRQDQLARWLQASIAARIASRAQAPINPVVQLSIKRLDDLAVAQVDASLPASLRDRRA